MRMEIDKNTFTKDTLVFVAQVMGICVVYDDDPREFLYDYWKPNEFEIIKYEGKTYFHHKAKDEYMDVESYGKFAGSYFIKGQIERA